MSITDQLAAAKETANKTPSAPSASAGQIINARPAGRMGVEQFMNSSAMTYDAYLKVSEHGLAISKHANELVESFEAEVRLDGVQYFTQIRYGKNPPVYVKTFNGVTATDGKPWQTCIEMAKAVEPGKSSDPFSTAEIGMKVLNDVKSFKNVLVAEAGTLLSYTPSFTGVGEWQALISDVISAGGNPEKAKVRVKVSSEAKARGSNKWGVVKFEFLGLVE